MIGLGKWRSFLAVLNKAVSSRNSVDLGTEVIFVSACDSSHFKSFKQLAVSFHRTYPKHTLQFVDLGLTKVQLEEIIQELPYVVVRAFPYSSYPSWMNIKIAAGNYGWKAQIVNEVMQRSPSGFLAWMDSGNVIDAPLSKELAVASHKGLYLELASETNEFWTHPSCVEAIGSPKIDLCRLQISAAAVVFDTRKPEIRNLIEDWASMSKQRKFIAPPGSSRSNHRQDQALLSLLAYRHMRTTRPIENVLGWHWPTAFSNFRIHQDID